MELKVTLYQTLSEQDKQKIKELTDKYKTSDCTLAEIFKVKAETYKNIPLSHLCLSVRIISAITRFKHIIDLEDLLNLTLPQIWKIRNIGEIAINELVLLIERYISKDSEIKNNYMSLNKHNEPPKEEIQNLLNTIYSQGRSVKEITELLEKNMI